MPCSTHVWHNQTSDTHFCRTEPKKACSTHAYAPPTHVMGESHTGSHSYDERLPNSPPHSEVKQSTCKCQSATDHMHLVTREKDCHTKKELRPTSQVQFQNVTRTQIHKACYTFTYKYIKVVRYKQLHTWSRAQENSFKFVWFFFSKSPFIQIQGYIITTYIPHTVTRTLMERYSHVLTVTHTIQSYLRDVATHR
jgi:hypothetical protein